jgi:DNA-binding Xre family transcriptional regulator
MVPKRVVCRLVRLMQERGLTQKQLHEISGVDVEVIRKLCSGRWKGVTKSVIGKLCAALGVKLSELFEDVPADIWFPIRRDRKVTVHLGSTSLEAHGGGPDGAYIDRLGIGTWDVRALFRVYEYLNSTTIGGVVFEYDEHAEALHDPARVEALFQRGNHLIFGSPMVNPMAEDAVCRGFTITPRDRANARGFPYRFRWDRVTDSSVDEFGGRSDPGIVRGIDELVARRTMITLGDGEDCGLVFTFRHNPITSDDDDASEDTDCVVIAIMGHGGCGTRGGTELACGDDAACELYPEERNVGTLRAFRVTYRRAEPRSGFDNRSIVSYELVPEPAS